ncbi:hypothetical protein PY793_07850 [Acetobacter fabarum]|uniref:hypothetical protein n=1 Tax=Acetobacter fabarum TaxID=483199 RepID=UPI00312B30E7
MSDDAPEKTETILTAPVVAPWWSVGYPAQYYAVKTGETLGGYPLMGWVDVSLFQSAPDWLPAASAMIALTSQQWSARTSDQILVDGVIEHYTPPAITLAAQAATALSAARTAVYNNYGILNEATPDAWVAYLKALMAIANGIDTTSTALPSAPTP